MNNPITQAIEALALILPMAKGYAHQHPVGNNSAFCDQAEAALASLRAAQEGDLPPLPEPAQTSHVTDSVMRKLEVRTHTADQMREYARLALAAAGGGVPHDALIQARDMLENWSSYVPPYFAEKHGLKDDFATLDKWIASSPQPEAAPAVAQVPKVCDGKEQDAFEAWASSNRYDMHTHPLHWLFLNQETASARDGWKGAIEYVNRVLAAVPEAPAQAAQSAGEVERGDVVAFEFYNRATCHAIVDYSVNTHVGRLSADKGYEARPLVYAAKREEVTDGSKPIPLWQAREALDELEAAARGDAPFNHQAAAVVRAALSHKEQR